MSDIILATLNAKYIHASFGLRYLMANLGDLAERTALLEFDINQHHLDIVEKIASHNPSIVGFGVYIWNVTETEKVVSVLKKILPNCKIILGGPEVSYAEQDDPLIQLADYVITGEADLEFSKLCVALLNSISAPDKIIRSTVPDLASIKLPYHLYSDDDIKNRVIYVEASRGCPFSCEFCLSSLDIPVRQFELDSFLIELDLLFKRGARNFKFVDRTFNMNLRTAQGILQFFLDRYEPGLFVHFEMIPDRLPEGLRSLIKKFPAGSLQFEVGIQSFNSAVLTLISRRQDEKKLEDNFKFLRDETGVHIHADLIVGLPGEDLESFGVGFDRLVSLRPQEIQVGILKRLKGTPIIRHDKEWGMKYSSTAPYEILETKLISFSDMQRMRRFARYWDMTVNSGSFVETVPLIWRGNRKPYASFLQFSDWLYSKVGRRHSIALNVLIEQIWRYLTIELGIAVHEAALPLWRDFVRTGRAKFVSFLLPYVNQEQVVVAPSNHAEPLMQKRQKAHLA